MKQELIVKLNSLNLEMVKYNLDESLNYDKEFIDGVSSAFVNGLDLIGAIHKMQGKFVDTEFDGLVRFSKYIEEDIDNFLYNCDTENFRDILTESQYFYYARQIRKNQFAFYVNAIIKYINNIKEHVLKMLHFPF